MPHHKSCQKRVRLSKRQNLKNREGRSKIKTFTKKVLNAQTKEEAEPVLKQAISIIDKSAKNGLIHKNNAANKKSSLTKKVAQLPS